MNKKRRQTHLPLACLSHRYATIYLVRLSTSNCCPRKEKWRLSSVLHYTSLLYLIYTLSIPHLPHLYPIISAVVKLGVSTSELQPHFWWVTELTRLTADKVNVLAPIENETKQYMCLLRSRRLCFVNMKGRPGDLNATKMVPIHWKQTPTNSWDGNTPSSSQGKSYSAI